MQASCWCELTLKARDRLFDRPFFYLQLECTVAVGGGGGEKRRLPEEAVKMPYAS